MVKTAFFHSIALLLNACKRIHNLTGIKSSWHLWCYIRKMSIQRLQRHLWLFGLPCWKKNHCLKKSARTFENRIISDLHHQIAYCDDISADSSNTTAAGVSKFEHASWSGKIFPFGLTEANKQNAHKIMNIFNKSTWIK